MSSYVTKDRIKKSNKKEYFESPIFIRHVIPLIKNNRVLDLGCNSGQYLAYLSNRSVGIDIKKDILNICKQHNLIVVQADLNYDLPFANNSFDTIICSHILEHVEAPIILLREANRVLKPHGLLIITCPIENSLVRFLLRDHYFKKHQTHLYAFSLANLRHLLALTNFVPMKTLVETPLIKKLHLWWFLDLIQIFPFVLTKWFAGNFYCIGEKRF